MACYSVRIAFLVYKQTTIDMFFIDWEKSPAKGLGDVESGKGAKLFTKTKANSISVWRTIFAVNEWSEIATVRRIDTAMTFLILATILEGADVRYVSTMQPSLTNLSEGYINPVLQFAISMFWFWIIAIIQLLWAHLIAERYGGENPTARYLDLCTIMKISVLILDERYRGYYLHGNSPHEYADGNMEEVSLNLFEEASAMRTGRGLPGCPDVSCQTFEVHVPLLWRESYDRIYASLAGNPSGGASTAMQSTRGGLPAGANAAASISAQSQLSTLGKGVERTRRLYRAHEQLAGFLRGFIQESDPDFKRVWKERSIAHSAFDLPPDMLAEGAAAAAGMTVSSGMGAQGGGSTGGRGDPSRITYMYTDPNMRFERAFFLGIELDLICFESLFFCFVDYLFGSRPTIAAAITLLLSFVIKALRESYGEENIASKTLVDKAFLG